MTKTADEYAREFIGAQALQIISLRAQLDAAQEEIKALHQRINESARPQESLPAVERTVG